MICRLYLQDCKSKINMNLPEYILAQDIKNLIKTNLPNCFMVSSNNIYLELEIKKENLKEESVYNKVFFVDVNKKFGVFKNKDDEWQIKLN